MCGTVAVRLSFHPLRSTALYVAAVNAVVLWSGYHTVQDCLRLLRAEDAPLTVRFPSLVSIAHLCCYPLVPIMWIESYKFCRLRRLSSNLNVGTGYWVPSYLSEGSDPTGSNTSRTPNVKKTDAYHFRLLKTMISTGIYKGTLQEGHPDFQPNFFL